MFVMQSGFIAEHLILCEWQIWSTSELMLITIYFCFHSGCLPLHHSGRRWPVKSGRICSSVSTDSNKIVIFIIRLAGEVKRSVHPFQCLRWCSVFNGGSTRIWFPDGRPVDPWTVSQSFSPREARLLAYASSFPNLFYVYIYLLVDREITQSRQEVSCY